jgi:hypothetical protein
MRAYFILTATVALISSGADAASERVNHAVYEGTTAA